MSEREHGIRVLIVEDEPRLREMLGKAIPDMGFDVGGVGSAEEARSVMEQEQCEIVILDLNLPGMSGMEFLQMIRERWPDTQVVIMTGYGDLEAAQEAIRLNVADFLSKPATLGDLEAALDRARRKVIRKIDPARVKAFAEAEDEEAESDDSPLTLQDLERKHILNALDRHDGNRQAVAEELGISVRKLYYRLDEYRKQGYMT